MALIRLAELPPASGGDLTRISDAELMAIAWIRNRYMDTPFTSAVFQVVLGGVLVFLAGILIGSA